MTAGVRLSTWKNPELPLELRLQGHGTPACAGVGELKKSSARLSPSALWGRRSCLEATSHLQSGQHRHILSDKPGAGQALLFLLNSQIYAEPKSGPDLNDTVYELKNEV